MNDELFKVLFRGYGKAGNKQPNFKRKGVPDEQLKSLEHVRTHFRDYGGVIRNGIVLVDLDDKSQAEKLLDLVKDLKLKTIVIETQRGMHFYFKDSKNSIRKSKSRVTSAVGFNVDYKLGANDDVGVIKFNDTKERKIVYGSQELDEVPKFLTATDFKHQLFGLGNHDGRNDATRDFILSLCRSGWTKEEGIECLKLTNQYVFSEPFDEKEFKTITRDDLWKAIDIFFDGRRFLFDKFGDVIMKQYYVKRILNNIHVYEDGIYKAGDDLLQWCFLQRIRNLTINQHREVLHYLKITIRENTPLSEARYIAFKNGVYDIETNQLLDFTPNFIIINKIPFNFNPNAFSELADKTLNKMACHDREVRMLLEEAIGYCMCSSNKFKKSFFFEGEADSGKSTFLNMLKKLLGKSNYSALQLQELSERFKPVKMFGKLVNIGDDLSDKYIDDPSMLKRALTGVAMDIEEKGVKSFEYEPYCKFIFAGNHLPKFNDPDNSTIKKLIIIPFDHVFSPDDPDFDINIGEKLEQAEVMEYLITLGLAGLKRILETNKFTISRRVSDKINEHKYRNNPLLEFFETELTVEQIIGKQTKDIILQYELWRKCSYKGDVRSFGIRLLKSFPGVRSKLIREHGQVVRIYVENVV